MKVYKEMKKYLKGIAGSITSVPIIGILLAYIVYGSFDGVMGILILNILFSFSVMIAFIPFVGFLLHYVAMKGMILPFVLSATGIGETWLTTLLLVIYVIIGLLTTVVSTKMFLKDKSKFRTSGKKKAPAKKKSTGKKKK